MWFLSIFSTSYLATYPTLPLCSSISKTRLLRIPQCPSSLPPVFLYFFPLSDNCPSAIKLCITPTKKCTLLIENLDRWPLSVLKECPFYTCYGLSDSAGCSLLLFFAYYSIRLLRSVMWTVSSSPCPSSACHSSFACGC